MYYFHFEYEYQIIYWILYSHSHFHIIHFNFIFFICLNLFRYYFPLPLLFPHMHLFLYLLFHLHFCMHFSYHYANEGGLSFSRSTFCLVDRHQSALINVYLYWFFKHEHKGWLTWLPWWDESVLHLSTVGKLSVLTVAHNQKYYIDRSLLCQTNAFFS